LWHEHILKNDDIYPQWRQVMRLLKVNVTSTLFVRREENWALFSLDAGSDHAHFCYKKHFQTGRGTWSSQNINWPLL